MTNEQLQSLLARAQSHEPAARYHEALQDLDALLAQAREGGATAFEAAALHHRGRVLRIKGELAAAEESVRQAADLFAALQDPVGQAQALLVKGEILSDQAKFREFEAACREAIRLARRANNQLVGARAVVLLGSSQILQGKADDARAYIEEGVAAYSRIGDRRGTATSLLMLGRVDHMSGRLGVAARATQDAVAIFEELGETRASIAACYALAQMNLERGIAGEARPYIDRGIALTLGTGDIVMELRCMLLRAQVDIELGEFAVALSTMREAQVLCSGYELASILPEIYRTMAQAQVGLGNGAEAENSALLAVQAAFEEDDYSQGTARLAYALAMAASGRSAEADAAFAEAVDRLEKAGETFEIGWGRLAWGQFLVAQGRRDEAGRHLARAREAFASLESQAKVSLIDSL